MEENSHLTCQLSSEEEICVSLKKAKAEKQNAEEFQFFRLFRDMLNIFINTTKISEENIECGIASIIKSFRWNKGNKFSDNDFNQTDILCGYLYRYSPHGAGLARKRIADAIDNCESLKNELEKSELNILSLGSGPGNDIVGFCSALYEIDSPRKLNITVTDSVQRFSSCLNLLKFLIREKKYGNVSDLFENRSVNMSFIQLTLPDNTNSKYLQILEEADIIVMSKLFSILDDDQRDGIIQNLHQKMKSSALLLYIDSPFSLELWEKFDVLHKSESEEYINMSFLQNDRFGHSDRVSSKAQIVVLRKK